MMLGVSLGEKYTTHGSILLDMQIHRDRRGEFAMMKLEAQLPFDADDLDRRADDETDSANIVHKSDQLLISPR